MQLLPALNQGGVERGTLDIARALVEAGHDSIVVSAGGRLVEQLEAEGSAHLALDIGRKSFATFFKASALARLILQHRPDIVHVRSRLPAWVLRLALKRIPVFERPKVVSTLHGLNSVSKYSEVMTVADRIIAVSETCLNYWRSNYPNWDSANAVVIPRGIDVGQFNPLDPDIRAAVRLELGLEENSIGLLLPGRITRIKGHLALVEVLAQCVERGLPVKAFIVGEGKPGSGYIDEIKQRASELGVEQHLVWLGHRSDMQQIYAAVDVTLNLTSTGMESFGRTPVESIACGTPVVAWDWGAVGETMRNLCPEGLVKVGDIDSTVNKSMAAKHFSLQPVELSGYTLSEMIKATLATYQELLRR